MSGLARCKGSALTVLKIIGRRGISVACIFRRLTNTTQMTSHDVTKILTLLQDHKIIRITEKRVEITKQFCPAEVLWDSVNSALLNIRDLYASGY